MEFGENRKNFTGLEGKCEFRGRIRSEAGEGRPRTGLSNCERLPAEGGKDGLWVRILWGRLQFEEQRHASGSKCKALLKGRLKRAFKN